MKTIYSKLAVLAVVLLLTQTAFAFYCPSTGCWPSRDPLGERGGMNLYDFVKNGPIYLFDRNGLDVNAPPNTAQSPGNSPVSTAGPDITVALEATLKQVDIDWKNNPTKHCAACKQLEAKRLFGGH